MVDIHTCCNRFLRKQYRFNRSNHDWKGRFKVRNTTKLGECWISSLVTTYIYILHVLVTPARIESNDDHEVVINGWHGAPMGHLHAPTPKRLELPLPSTANKVKLPI